MLIPACFRHITSSDWKHYNENSQGLFESKPGLGNGHSSRHDNLAQGLEADDLCESYLTRHICQVLIQTGPHYILKYFS